jgi:hypothetical protein
MCINPATTEKKDNTSDSDELNRQEPLRLWFTGASVARISQCSNESGSQVHPWLGSAGVAMSLVHRCNYDSDSQVQQQLRSTDAAIT